MNTITQNSDGTLSCSCGAKAERSERARFRKRHPAKCQVALKIKQENLEFTKKLAAGTRHQDSISFEPKLGDDTHVILINKQIKEIYLNLDLLNEWELDFMENVKNQWTMRSWLSDSQLEVLARIYKNKC